MKNNTTSLFLHSISVKPDSPKTGFTFSIPAIANLNLSIKKHVTFLVGENGSGKSTILEALADRIGFSTMGGTKHHRFIEEYKMELANHLLLQRDPRLPIGQGFFFRAESFFNLAEYIDEKGITQVKYEETEHYQITKGFLNNPDKYFKMLFDS